MVVPGAYVLLILIALLLTIASGVTGRVPLWIALLLVCIALLLR